jgi:glucokinase
LADALRTAKTDQKLTGPDVTAVALQGDQTAAELIGDVGTWLGRGIANLAAALDPELFVVGGGVSEAGGLLLRPAIAAFERSLTGRGYRPVARLALAHFRNDAGLIGAADLARHSISEPPGFLFWPRRRTPRGQRLRKFRDAFLAE